MDYENKYKEALEKAREWSETKNGYYTPKELCEKIFPELRKNEDEYLEKIKKDIISYLNNRKIDSIAESSATEKWIDWLEKQKLTKNINKEEEEVRQYLIRTMKQKDINVPMVQKALDWLEKQGGQKKSYMMDNKKSPYSEKRDFGYLEKKPADSYCQENCKGFQETGKCFADWDCKDKREAESNDEVKPKFHKGQWITNGYYTWKIVEVRPLDYILQSQDGNIVDDTIFHVNEQFHSFTIEDAKDGDVVANDKIVLIIDHLGTFENRPIIYSWYFADSNKFYGEGTNECDRWEVKGFTPATKEQCDHLYSKMKEAGYEWDTEKKELKKIENRPMLSDFFNAEYERGKADAISEIQKGWTEDDKNHMANILNILLMEAKNAKVEQYRSSVESDIDWIYSLKNKSCVQPKQEWSEEDEDYINDLIKYFSQNDKLKNTKKDIVIWLKSIKQRIGG